MKDAQPKTIYLKDYQVPDFLIDKTELHFTLDPKTTAVKARLSLRRNPAADNANSALVLSGQEMKLKSVALNGVTLNQDGYRVDADSLIIESCGNEFILETVVEIDPESNTSLEGLYKSRSMYCTQCEAEGFRKITYYLDRPDVLSEFTTTIVGDKTAFPVLLSNGNQIDEGELEGGLHFATWHDPFKKPAYLFALVGGDLEFIEDRFITQSQREVTLKIFVESKDLDKCDHAMTSLKNSMRWDEEVYGREYDLDIFMIVAVDDFNMGAMENKGLNIFNTSCVLAKPETTTDVGFQRVEAVVAHEYFHNWSGNRVTCRDWFQLSLKEGFTVFRDSQFSADMNSTTVKRVEDVSFLRTLQFAEDGGPMSHPVRPASFMEISNFYTLTIYEKGAEVVRMIHTLLGAEDFRKGSDLYFDRHDGEAATIENFVSAMEDASGRNLDQFTRWYSQAGTPRVEATGEYHEDLQQYHLTLSQSCPDTPEAKGAEKRPFVIPVAMGLLGDAGNLALQVEGEAADFETSDNTHRVLELDQATKTFVFQQVFEEPIPVLLREFSAPVKLEYGYRRHELKAIMSRDSDGFSRWDASQKLALLALNDIITAYRGDQNYVVEPLLIDAYRSVLTDESLDQAMVALMVQLPSEAYLSELSDEADVEAIHFAREYLKTQLASGLQLELESAYRRSEDTGTFSVDSTAIAKRSLKNTALSYLSTLPDNSGLNLAQQQLSSARNMTDELAGLGALNQSAEAQINGQRDKALSDFYQRWKHEALVVNQWLQVQASCQLPGALQRVKTLMEHESFDVKNPNKVRSVIGVFASSNAIGFHVADGSGYEFLADQILLLDALNPQVASRMLSSLTKWRKYSAQRQEKMRAQLARILAQPGLSKDVYEVVSKSLS
jgi:aminopeptidase N